MSLPKQLQVKFDKKRKQAKPKTPRSYQGAETSHSCKIIHVQVVGDHNDGEEPLFPADKPGKNKKNKIGHRT